MPDQIIQFPFQRGLDSKTDKHSKLVGGVDNVINGVFDKLGAIQKRHGNVSQGNTVKSAANAALSHPLVGPTTLPFATSSGGINVALAYAMFGYGMEQVLLDAYRLYSYSTALGAHISRDNAPEANLSRRPISNLSWALGWFNPDVAICNGYEVWIGQTGNAFGSISTLQCVVFDLASGNIVMGPIFMTAGALPKLCVPTATKVVLTYEDFAGNISARTLDTTNLAAQWGAPGLLSNQGVVSSSAVYDATACGDGNFIVAFPNTGGGVTVGTFPPTTYTPNTTTTLGTDTNLTSVAVQGTVGEQLYVAWGNNTGIVKVQGLTVASLVSNFAAFTAINFAGATSIPQLGLARLSAAQEAVVCNVNPTSLNIARGSMQVITSGGATTGSPCPFFDLWLNSRPFQFGGKTYAMMFKSSLVQGTFFLVDLNVDFGGALNQGTDYWPRKVAGTANRLCLPTTTGVVNNPMRGVGVTGGSLANVALVSGAKFITPISVLQGQGLVGQQRLWRSTVDFAHPGRGRGGQLGRSYVVASSVYDGQAVSELGFDVYPETCTATAVGAGGNLSAGTYQYMMVYMWTTASGETIRSTGQPGSAQVPTSQALSVTTVNNDSVNLVTPILQVSAKNDGEALLNRPVMVEIYRTQVGGVTFNLVTRIPMYLANAPANQGSNLTVLYTDTAPDASILTNPLLYFTPGFPGTVLENVSPPCFSDTWIHKNRPFGIGDDLRTVWYGKQFVEGQQCGFNEGLTVAVEDGNDLIAGFSMDDKWFVTTKYNTYYSFGDGPDPTGTNGAFAPMQQLAADVGCVDPRSIVKMPDGIIFLSLKGLVILTRALEVIYLDGPEDALRSFPNVTSAVLFAENNEVRFTCNNGQGAGIILVCNYWQPDAPYKYRWSQFQLYDSVAQIPLCLPLCAGYVNGSYRWISAQGNPFTEDNTPISPFVVLPAGAFMDGGTAPANWVTMSATTSWIELGGFAGYHRCKRVQPVGDWFTSHDLNISVGTEFNPSTALPPGNSRTFKSDATDGLFFERAMLAVKNQKATSIQVTISDAYPTGTAAVVASGRGMSLAGIGLRIGTKDKMGALLPAAQRG